MTGWNLPPGVNVRDIPGNRPEDALWEKEAEKFCEDCQLKYKCDRDIDLCCRSREFEKRFEELMYG